MRIKILIILIVGIVMAGACYMAGLFTRYNYLTAWYDRSRGNICQVYFGKPSANMQWRKVVAKQMGFDLKYIGGCTINPANTAGADEYNSVMNNALDKKFGKGWKKRFDEKADSLFIAHDDARVTDAAMRINDIQQLKHICDSLKPGSFFIKIYHFARTDSIHPNVLVCRHVKAGDAVMAYYRIDPYSMISSRIMY